MLFNNLGKFLELAKQKVGESYVVLPLNIIFTEHILCNIFKVSDIYLNTLLFEQLDLEMHVVENMEYTQIL